MLFQIFCVIFVSIFFLLDFFDIFFNIILILLLSIISFLNFLFLTTISTSFVRFLIISSKLLSNLSSFSLFDYVFINHSDNIKIKNI